MGIYANPVTNKVYVNWERPNQKETTFFKTVNGKRLSFIGSEERKKDAEEIKEFRKKRYNRTTKIVKLGGEYLLYSH